MDLTSTHLLNGTVMLSEAKHLCFFRGERSRNDQRFFSRNCGLRMTL